MTYFHANRAPRSAARRHGSARSIGACLVASFFFVPQSAFAAPGDVLFSDGFEAGFGKWTTTNTLYSGINTMAASSPTRSLYVRGNTVTTTSIAIDTRVPALRVTAWIRRGSDAFSEQPDSGEDLVIEYLDSSGAWVALGFFPGAGTAGAILALDQTLGANSLHAAFRLRVRLVRGSGGPPDNFGIGWDYWHIDEIAVREGVPSTGLALGRCEEFSAGMSGWSVTPGFGQAQITTQTANTPSQSLALQGGTVVVTSQTVDLGSTRDTNLRFWLRRGDDRFSEDPDTGEDFYVDFLDSSGQWRRLATHRGDGVPGEIMTPSVQLVGSAHHPKFRLRFGMTGRDGPGWDFWHVDSVCLTSQAATANWRFEEERWTQTNGEVKDSSPNAFDARSEGDATTSFRDAAIDGNPGTCRHATFDGQGDGVFLASGGRIDLVGAATYTAWMQPHTASGARHVIGMNTDPSISNRSQMGLFAQDGALLGRAVTRAGTYAVKAELPPQNAWTHVALSFDGKNLILYQNARAVASTSFAETTLVGSGRELGLGNVPETRNASFQGFLDEARVYASALDATTLARVMAETRACATVAVHFVVRHDGSGAHCQPETIRVGVRDPLGNPVPTYAGTITLDTQTATGSWSLVAGNGYFLDAVAGDGRATYAFDPSDLGEASFALSYSSGPSPIDVDVYDAAGRDDDTEGLLAFAPSSLALTANAVPNPAPPAIDDPLGTQVAGSVFRLHLTAVGGGTGGTSCGVISSYDGDKALAFWFDALDPKGPPLVPRIDGTAIATSEAAAAARTVRFSQGRAQVTVQYKDTGRLALAVVDLKSSPSVRGSTSGFVSIPADLRVIEVANALGESNPGADSPTGKLFARAGEPFSAVVEVLDAEGDLTPSFGREAIPEGIRLQSSMLVAPESGRNGTTDEGILDDATAFAADAKPGRFVGKTFAFDEVGAIRLRARVADDDYLGAGPVEGSNSEIVGRFAPDHFTVAPNAPRFATSCPVGAFTWLGQPFGFEPGREATLLVTAVNRAGGTTANYQGDWFRLSNATLANRRYSAGGAGAAGVDESGLPDPSRDPAIRSNGDGSARLTFSSGTGIALARTAPTAPFEAELALSLDILDADATAYPANPFRLGGTAPGAGLEFDVSKRFQFGRLRLDNAFGSELVRLPMRLRTQRFDGTAFVDDDADSCSRIPSGALALLPTPAALASAAALANLPLLAGEAGLSLAAPGAPGTIDLELDLGLAGANLPWLRGDWPEDGNQDGRFDDDPRARATFGIWKGRDAVIFQRELY